jgi:type III pantothenate kinase
MLLCIDIGNTHTHYGVVDATGTLSMGNVRTREIDHFSNGMGAQLSRLFSTHPGINGIAFCSVVPDATQRLRSVFDHWGLTLPTFHLTHEKRLGLQIGYPRPSEIGQDRLANAVGAHSLYGAPTVVIDMGTAVTFDIVSRARGYEGGIIAPGIEVMRRYLHEQTALLPRLDDGIEVDRAIGQSTLEAMRIGTVIGFGGMIQALLKAVMQELDERGETPVRILTTGGSAELLKKTLTLPFDHVPDLTLRGLAAAWQLNAN